jgi:hypothetical protein
MHKIYYNTLVLNNVFVKVSFVYAKSTRGSVLNFYSHPLWGKTTVRKNGLSHAGIVSWNALNETRKSIVFINVVKRLIKKEIFDSYVEHCHYCYVALVVT